MDIIVYINMIDNFNLTENKIKTLLDEFNKDREKLFSDLKMSNDIDPVKEKKIKQLEILIKNILSYKKILLKEISDKDKDN
jgi:hypothetical protein